MQADTSVEPRLGIRLPLAPVRPCEIKNLEVIVICKNLGAPLVVRNGKGCLANPVSSFMGLESWLFGKIIIS
jgi:hypothetical protein